MRPDRVVVVAPTFGQGLVIPNRVKHTPVQQFGNSLLSQYPVFKGDLGAMKAAFAPAPPT